MIFSITEYHIHLAILICIYLILAQSFNFSFGMGGLFNLAHVSIYAIGAYATALLATEHGFGFFGATLVSMTLSGLFSLLIGYISLRLSDDYFAIGTLAFSSVVLSLLINWKSVTHGVMGIPGIPRPVLFDYNMYENRNFLILALSTALVSQLLLLLLFRNSFARSLRAQAEFDFAAQSLGKRVNMIKMVSFTVASIFAGLAGSFFSYYISYIDPSSFSLTEMVFILTIAVVGRPGSFWGVVGSTIFLVLLPEPLRFLEIPPSILGPLRQMLYAVILFVLVYMNRAILFPVKREV